MAGDLPVRHNGDEHRFEIDLGDGLAIAAYALHDGKIIFTHTEVPPQREGRGIGTRLIEAGLDHARTRRLQVIPSCPFFAAYMRKRSEVHDLLSPYDREKLGIA